MKTKMGGLSQYIPFYRGHTHEHSSLEALLMHLVNSFNKVKSQRDRHFTPIIIITRVYRRYLQSTSITHTHETCVHAKV